MITTLSSTCVVGCDGNWMLYPNFTQIKWQRLVDVPNEFFWIFRLRYAKVKRADAARITLTIIAELALEAAVDANAAGDAN